MGTWKPWKFGSLVRSLPVIKNLENWTGSGVVANHEIAPPCHGKRDPSRALPEMIESVLRNPREFLVKSRIDWDLHKMSRLLAGEFYRIGPSREIVLENCWVHLPSGSVITAAREVVEKVSHGPNQLYKGHSPVDFENAPWIEEECFLLATVWGSNFAHWIMDALPRLGGPIERPQYLLLGNRVEKFQIESLELLGFKSMQFIIPACPLVRCRMLRAHVASVASGIPHPACMLDIRSRVLMACKPFNAPQTRRLYISRQQTRRRIVNHKDVVPIIDNFGFEHLTTEEMRFEDQVRSCAEADILLGVHGAGTLNVLFASAGARLVEIYNPKVWDHSAHRMATLCGISHLHMFADNAGKDFDIRVNPQKLSRLLALASNEPPEKYPELMESLF